MPTVPSLYWLFAVVKKKNTNVKKHVVENIQSTDKVSGEYCQNWITDP